MKAKARIGMVLVIAIGVCLILPFVTAARAQTYSVISGFSAAERYPPVPGLTFSGGTLYGATASGGSNNCGTVFALKTDGSGCTVLHLFSGADGCVPPAGLVLSGSTLFGTTSQGGPGYPYGYTMNGYGTVFKINTDGSGFTVLHAFAGGPSDGAYPCSRLVLSGTTLYGTTEGGGIGSSTGSSYGTVFKVNTDGSGYAVLKSFGGPGDSGGSYPLAGLALSGDTLFGSTYQWGGLPDGIGTIFSLRTDGSAFTVLWTFTGGDGAQAQADLLVSGGVLYGTTSQGGTYFPYGYGTVFKINTDGSGFTMLHSFSGTDGASPLGGALVLSDGRLYGTTVGSTDFSVGGTVFSLRTDGADFTVLQCFGPWGWPTSLILSGSTLYGTVNNGVCSIAIPCIPHDATATAAVVNGFVVGVNTTDGGCGYTNAPALRIIGGGGSGAQAVAVVNNGVVIAVNVLDAGSGYTNTPVIVIAPPFIPQPTMGIAPRSLILSFANLAVGTNYQLQSFLADTWANIGPAFTAAGPAFTQYVSGTAGPSGYRLASTPVPLQAYATAQVVNGFVVGATVTSGGSGYTTNPAVTIVGDGGGSNATAVATVSGGSVTGITITGAGLGYTNTPTIMIAPPPATALWPSVTQVMELDLGSLSPYDNYQLEFTPAAGGAWSNLGIPFTPTSATSTQDVNVSGNAGFFRVRYVP